MNAEGNRIANSRELSTKHCHYARRASERCFRVLKRIEENGHGSFRLFSSGERIHISRKTKTRENSSSFPVPDSPHCPPNRYKTRWLRCCGTREIQDTDYIFQCPVWKSLAILAVFIVRVFWYHRETSKTTAGFSIYYSHQEFGTCVRIHRFFFCFILREKKYPISENACGEPGRIFSFASNSQGFAHSGASFRVLSIYIYILECVRKKKFLQFSTLKMCFFMCYDKFRGIETMTK